MTTIRRTVKRETRLPVFERGERNVIVSIEPPGIIGFRLKGTRTTYSLPADSLWYICMKAAIAEQKREKAKAKKERQHARKG